MSAGLGEWLRAMALLRHADARRALVALTSKHRLLEDVRQSNAQAKITDGVEVYGFAAGRLVIGDRSAINHGTVLAFGDDANGHGAIRIGENTWIGQYNNLRACSGGDVTIGSDCLLSQFCTLAASNHSIRRGETIRSQGDDQRRLGVTVEDDVWLGAGVVLLPGVVVHRGAVVGANAVVASSIPEYEIWAGAPARKIGERT